MKPEPEGLHGLQRVCRLYGRMKCGEVTYAWDYANECAVDEKTLRADKSRFAASEKAKWMEAQPDARGPGA